MGCSSEEYASFKQVKARPWHVEVFPRVNVVKELGLLVWVIEDLQKSGAEHVASALKHCSTVGPLVSTRYEGIVATTTTKDNKNCSP